MKNIKLFILFLFALPIYGQKVIPGRVLDENNKPVEKVFISTYTGHSSVTGTDGRFMITMPEDSSVLTIFFTCATYRPKQLNLYVEEDSMLVRMIDLVTELGGVTITADKYSRYSNYSAQIPPITTDEISIDPNACGDLLGGLSGMPGVQSNADDGQLIIQGGDTDESIYYIDGLIAFEPYEKGINGSNRFKFGNGIFSGTSLHTSGFSAAYGNALSGTVQLETSSKQNSFPKLLELWASPMGGGGLYGSLSKEKLSVTLGVSDMNLTPYYKVMPSEAKWDKYYNNVYVSYFMVNRFNKHSNLRTTFHYNYARGLYHRSIDSVLFRDNIDDHDFFLNTAGDIRLTDNLNLYVGGNISFRQSKTVDYLYMSDSVCDRKIHSHLKAEVNYFKNKISNRIGVENVLSNIDEKYHFFGDTTLSFNNSQIAVFDELSLYITPNLNLNMGVRYEYSTLLKEHNVVPRAYIGYKINEHHLLSASTGLYNQLPQNTFLLINKDLRSRRAFNSTLSYRFTTGNYMFQIDGFYKKYDRLITYENGGEWGMSNIGNNGYGHAEGASVFFKGTSFKIWNYYLTYNYTNAHLLVNNYTRAVMPSYLSHHNFKASTTLMIPPLRSIVGVGLFVDDGATFYRYGNADESTKSPYRLGLNAEWGVMIGHFASIFFLAQNVTARKNVYGYVYSRTNPEYKHSYSTFDQIFFWLNFNVTFASKEDKIKHFKNQMNNNL